MGRLTVEQGWTKSKPLAPSGETFVGKKQLDIKLNMEVPPIEHVHRIVDWYRKGNS